jgi:protein arginine kinase
VKVPSWVASVGTETVLCSRARLARNLPEIPFRGTVSPQDARRLCERVMDSLRGMHPAFSPFADETSEEVPSLVDALRIPANLVDPQDPGPWLALEDSDRGVLVLDGDHLRIWSRRAGSSLPEALEEAAELERLVREALPLVRDPRFGWVAASPADAGTGLRASLLLHLPALCAAGRTLGLHEAMEALGHPLRPVWNGSPDEDAGLFLLTHRRSLGVSESAIVEGLERAAAILLREEDKATSALLLEWSTELQDAVARSASVLSSARLLSRRELSARCRWLALGARLGWIPAVQARLAMEAHLRTGDRSLERSMGQLAGEFEGSLDEWRARETVALFRDGLSDG